MSANLEIYTMAADGSAITRVTDHSALDAYPRWSPAGSEIAFISNRHSGTDSLDLNVIEMATDEVRRVTTGRTVFGHEWSPDGSSLVYAHDTGEGLEIRAVSADGSGDRFVVEGSWPSFSPDGSRILFTRGEFFVDPQSLAIVAVDGGAVTAVPVELANSSEATWAPTGDRMAFMSNPNGYEGSVDEWDEEIYIASIDGSGVVRVSNRPGNDHWPPSWSDDGRCLAWQGDISRTMDSDILAIAVEGGEPMNLTADSGFVEMFPDWSPGACSL